MVGKVAPYPQVEVVDFIRLMQDFLAKRIDVDQYRRSYFDLSKMRMDVPDDEDKILQEAYGDADDFDDVVHLENTIDEAQLRERVSGSLERLRARGHAIPDYSKRQWMKRLIFVAEPNDCFKPQNEWVVMAHNLDDAGDVEQVAGPFNSRNDAEAAAQRLQDSSR
jgi:Bacterial self-protective colicin-like immunity